jgi:hypothetical protein
LSIVITRDLYAIADLPSTEIQGRIKFQLVFQTSELPSESPRLGDLVDRANQSLDRLDDPAEIIGASDQVATRAADVVNTVASALGPLLVRFKVFMEIVDQLGDRLAEVYDYIDSGASPIIG